MLKKEIKCGGIQQIVFGTINYLLFYLEKLTLIIFFFCNIYI
jgi:hypothetical protein